MSSRPAPPATDAEWSGSLFTEENPEPLSEADRLALEEAEAAVARGEWVEGDIVMAKLDAMIAKHRARAAAGRK